MTERKTVVLVAERQKETARSYIDAAEFGWVMTLTPAKKKRIQEEKYHAMIGDISEQTRYADKRWDKDDTKRIMIDEFADEMRNQGRPLHHDGRLIPSENGRRVIQLGIQSKDFWVKEATDFITFLYAWGADRGVIWTEPDVDANH